MNIVDLHVHSNKSDGSMSPSQLVGLAAEKGLCAFALTDHDTTEGIPEAMEAARRYNDALAQGMLLCPADDRKGCRHFPWRSFPALNSPPNTRGRISTSWGSILTAKPLFLKHKSRIL